MSPDQEIYDVPISSGSEDVRYRANRGISCIPLLLHRSLSEQMCVIRACKVGDGGVPYQSWSPIFGGCRFVLLFIFNAVREK